MKKTDVNAERSFSDISVCCRVELGYEKVFSLVKRELVMVGWATGTERFIPTIKVGE